MALQEQLKNEVSLDFDCPALDHVAGVDVGFEGKTAVAAAAVLGFPGLDLEEYAISRQPATFPYIPGLLSFREAPAVVDALEKLSVLPDLILCDGQGIAHPRRFGIACHIGLITGIPTIGVGKTLLVGRHAEVPEARGAWVPLEDRGEVIGAVLRTRVGVKPVYVSPGHKMDIGHAVELVMAATRKYRLPETTRWAHRLASEIRPT